MNDNFIFVCSRVVIGDRVSEDLIECSLIPFGYFDKIYTVTEFIEKHGNDEKDCFYVVDSWIKNPTHKGQCESSIHLVTYDRNGKLYRSLGAHRFINHYNSIDDINSIQFRGRDVEDLCGEKGGLCCYFDRYTKDLRLGEIIELPPLKSEVPESLVLDSYDDSYMIKHPEGKIVDHVHIPSPLVFEYSRFN